MNSDHIGVVLIAFFKCLSCLGAIGAAYYLCLNGKDGWGWFIFAAVLLGAGSYKLD